MLELAKQACFEISKADWIKVQRKQRVELSDDEPEEVAVENLNTFNAKCMTLWCDV